MTDPVPLARDAHVVAPRIARKFWKRAAVTLRRLWRDYWDHQVRRATAAILQKLDDRALADIGIGRDEIGSLVDAGTRDRLRRCGWP